jgi:hypothetical protein
MDARSFLKDRRLKSYVTAPIMANRPVFEVMIKGSRQG